MPKFSIPTPTYPVEQDFRLRWIKWILYGGSVVLIILLAILNLILAGYDTAVVLLSDPNVTNYEQWWAPKSLPDALKLHTKPADCNEQWLPMGTPLRTNSSLPLFSYFLSNNFDQYSLLKQNTGERQGTPYQANPMDICDIKDTMNLTMDPRMLSFSVDIAILCDPIGQPPRARQFRTSFKRAFAPRFQPDSVLQFMAYAASPGEVSSNAYQKISQDGPPQNTFLNILGVMDALGADLIKVMHMRMNRWNSTGGLVPELAGMTWDPNSLGRGPADPTRLTWRTYADGNWNEGDPYLAAINQTIVNMFVATRDAIHLDLGYYRENNVYTNKTAFNRFISSDAIFPVLASQNIPPGSNPPGLRGCSWGWGCPNDINVSWAQMLTSTDRPVHNLTLPVPVSGALPVSVIDVLYLCPQYKLKSWGSVLVAVFTGTFTMYLTVYEIFMMIAPAMDQRRHGPQPLEKFMQQLSQDSGISRPRSSPDDSEDEEKETTQGLLKHAEAPAV